MQRKGVMMDKATAARAVEIGGGNFSKGVRTAIEVYVTPKSPKLEKTQ